MKYVFRFAWRDGTDESKGLDGEVVMPPETTEEDAAAMAWHLLELGNTVEMEALPC